MNNWHELSCCGLLVGKGSEIGDFLTQHPAVNCISFTGGDTGISVSKKVSCFASSSVKCAHFYWGKRSISMQNNLTTGTHNDIVRSWQMHQGVRGES